MFISDYINKHNVVVIDIFNINDYTIYQVNTCTSIFTNREGEIQFAINNSSLTKDDVMDWNYFASIDNLEKSLEQI